MPPTAPPTDRELTALGWSARQLRALAALFDTIAAPAYEGGGDRHARLAAAALTDAADPSDLRQLRVLLSVFEAPVGTPTLTDTRANSPCLVDQPAGPAADVLPDDQAPRRLLCLSRVRYTRTARTSSSYSTITLPVMAGWMVQW